MWAYVPMGGAGDWAGFPYAAESFRSALPLLESFGFTTAEDLDVDTLGDRLRAEVQETKSPIVGATLVSAWARKP